MLKEELRELAVYGVRRKVEAIERQLAELHAEFPEVFISDTPPMLVKAEQREEGNGWNGNMQSNLKRASAASAAWTPERKAKASRAMKARLKKYGGNLANAQKAAAAEKKKQYGGGTSLTAKKTTKDKTKKKADPRKGRSQPGGWKNKWYDRLETLGLDERVGESAKALKTTSANLLTASRGWLQAGIIKKTGPGAYAIGGPKPAEE